MIDNQSNTHNSTVDLEYWIHERDIDDVRSDYKCSACDFDDTLYNNLVEKFYRYCPYCGTRLNGVKSND